VGLGLVVLALGAYLLARETRLFAIDRIEVEGGSRPVARQVHEALASLVGSPLVGLDGSAVLQKVEALPTVESASYDREFPHTLRITIVPERPASVLRRGAATWLVSSRGRVMERLQAPTLPRLPRIWITDRTPVRTGAELEGSGTGALARAVGQSGALGARIATASYSDGTLVFRLYSGLEVLLGNAGEVRLKVAVAERILGRMPAGTTFLDVSLPGRPVSGSGSPGLVQTKRSSRG
jgi:cell division protein FtsQ